MPSALLCSSHTPLLREGGVNAATGQAVRHGFSELARHVRQFAPDIVVQFSPDHFNGFFYELMPPFCIGAAATSIGDWGTEKGTLPVDGEVAHDLAAALMADSFDVALSYRMMVDHGTTQIWEEMFGDFRHFPMVPVFINAIAPPLPTYRRVRLLGEAVGRMFRKTGKRVLFAASGGLSHDPPVPRLVNANEETRTRIIWEGRNLTPEARAARQDKVRMAGRAAATGASRQLPLNPAWDRHVLDLVEQGNISAFDRFDTTAVANTAGFAANETLAWVAATAAHAVSGPADITRIFYKDIPEWIAGMAMLFGTTRT